MTQTENLSLNLWESSDPVNLDQINANFSKLDSPHRILLSTKRVTSSTTYLDLDTSSIDWSRFKEVTLRCYLNGSGTLYVTTNGNDNYNRCAFWTGSSITADYVASVTLKSSSEVWSAWIALKCGYCPSRTFLCATDQSYGSHGYNDSVTFSNLSTLQFSNSSATINAGSYVEVWGEL
ncbi:MAG: hypothetical protein R3Y62_06525 [Eubacteriales bacterium]